MDMDESREIRNASLTELRDQIIKADRVEAIADIRAMLENREDRGEAEEDLIALADAAIAHLKGKKSQRALTIVCLALAAVIAAFVIYVLAT